jgi:hypothetical protein
LSKHFLADAGNHPAQLRYRFASSLTASVDLAPVIGKLNLDDRGKAASFVRRGY